MSEVAESDYNKLLSKGAYGLAPEEKRTLMLASMQSAYVHHYQNCEAYRRFCHNRGLDERSRFDSLEAIPYLPVQAFKENANLLCSVPEEDVRTRLFSSATSGVPSSVPVDKVTAKRQVVALSTILAEVFGAKRRPFLIFDADPRTAGSQALGARSAAVRGFLNLAKEARYFMEAGAEGELGLLQDAFASALGEYAERGEPLCVFGFTYVLYIYGIQPLKEAGVRFKLPEGSTVAHIGGWKKLVDQQVSKEVFNRDVAEIFGIPESSVVDFYGFTEQMGVTYPDSPSGLKYAPAFAEVIVRDPKTFEPLPKGKAGLLQFLTPLTHAYPGISVLTDDMGMLVDAEASDGWSGTAFKILGRAPKAEVRGCGDIMSEKVSAPKRHKSAGDADSLSRDPAGVRLLFGPERNHTSSNLLAPVNLEQLPDLESIGELADSLRAGREKLDDYSVDELIMLIDAAARKWVAPDSTLKPLMTQGLQFLSSWCRGNSLRRTADRSLSGARGVLDHFTPSEGTNRRLLYAQSRGLVVHWLSGNVPLLGMLALAQSILTRNANLLKAASSFSSVLPNLLETFRGLEVVSPSGKVLRGDDILASIAVIYFSREHDEAAHTLSRAADVRLAWGGKEAIEAVMNLPKLYGCEDVIFGPKLSYMVIGKENLNTDRMVKRMARNAATDASVFDQYACASPHTIFVEEGAAACSPEGFAARLAEEMQKALVRIAKAPVDSGTASAIESARIRHEFTGKVWRSAGTEWTVLYDEAADQGLASPCYSRVITVRAIDDIQEAASFAHRGIQTVGLGLQGARRLAFAQRAAKLGAERFPDIGRMTLFDSPWDGLYLMDRLVRWVSVGGPY